MSPGDRVYFLIDHFTEVAGTVVSFCAESGKVVVLDDDDGDLLHGLRSIRGQTTTHRRACSNHDFRMRKSIKEFRTLVAPASWPVAGARKK